MIMKRDFKKFFRLELKKGPIYDPRTHGEYVWNFGKLKGQSAYNTGYRNCNYIIWCYENIKEFDIPERCKMDFMDSLENNIVSYYHENDNEQLNKYLKSLVEYCGEYLYLITDHSDNSEKDELLTKLINNYISENNNK